LFSELEKFTTLNALGDFVSLKREVSWNLRNLFEKRHTKHPTRTVEYRRCPMSSSVPDIYENIAINLSFAHTAFVSDSELLGGLGAIAVVNPGNLALEPRDDCALSADSLKLGTRKFEQFMDSMVKSAKTLELGESLPKVMFSERTDKKGK